MLIDDYRNAIRAKNYSKKTFEAYWPHVVEYLRFCKVGVIRTRLDTSPKIE